MGTQGECSKKKSEKKNSKRQPAKKRAKKNSESGVEENGGTAALGAAEAASEAGDAADNPNDERREVRAKPKRAVRVKRECKQKVLNEMDGIVAGLIEKAKGGNSSQAKLLFEKFGIDFADAKKARAAKRKASGAAGAAEASLAELLLNRLDGEEHPAATGGQRRKASKAEREAKSKNDGKPEEAKARSATAAGG